MFKRVLTYEGFWRSVAFLSVVYLVILLVIQWFATGFSSDFFYTTLQYKKIWLIPVAGFIAGFMVSYGKFWAILKRQDQSR
jgi:asparagine N-glycosylation enzyme membrane subunit Stt3